MKSAKFISVIASSYKVDVRTVSLYARLLREAGFLTTGARGVNAPHMTPLDAARMTIALLATDSPARAVEMLKRFRGLVYIPDRSKGSPPEEWKVGEGATFEGVLENLFANMNSGGLPYVEIQENARSATIEFSNGGIYFRSVDASEELRAADRRDLFGIRRSRGVASAETMQIALHFYLEQRVGFDWETRVEAGRDAHATNDGRSITSEDE